MLAALAACGDEDAASAHDDGGPSDPRDGATVDPDVDAATADAGEHDASVPADAGHDDAGGPPAFGGLVPDTAPDAQELDLFGTPGHRFWIEVNEEQLRRMNSGVGGFPGPLFDGLGQALAAGDPLLQQLQRDMNHAFDQFGEDIYEPGDVTTFADHVVVQDAVSASVADYGKVEVKLVGESTARVWDFAHIPNVRIDSDEYEPGKRIGGVEHLRLNNSLVGSIFREAIAHRIFRELDYPALRATWAFLGSNVWSHDVWVPMTLIEVYKRKFCDDNAELLGGTCENMWEFPGRVGEDVGPMVPGSACQVEACDNTRLEELIDLIATTPAGPGFKDALSDVLEWERFHQFQCLGWILATGDDPIRNGNNNLIIERDDGKLIWAPYSIDISAGQDWYPVVPLLGETPLASRCQSDPACWADTVAACEDLIVKFDALDPEAIVDEAASTLTELGMMRSGDEERAELLRQWYLERQMELAGELERYRHLPDELGNCPEGLQACGDGGCGTPEDCITRSCEPGQEWCDSLARCIDQNTEACPSCSGEEPLFCHLNSHCVATLDECWASCAATPGFAYCAAYDSCAPEGECFDSEEDAGVVFPL